MIGSNSNRVPRQPNCLFRLSLFAVLFHSSWFFAATTPLHLVSGKPLVAAQEPASVVEEKIVDPKENADREDRQQQVQQDLATLKSIVSQDAGQSVNEQLTQLGLKYLPEVHVDAKKWGKTKEFKTLIPRSEPLVLNHGTWMKYEVKPIDSENRFRIRLKNLRSESAKLYFTLECDAALELEARQAKWVRGVQLYSINAEGEADLTLSLDCEVKVTFDFSDVTYMVISPKILTSDITIHDFRIHRVSKVGGEISQQITKAAREWLDDHESEHEQKLVTKLNQQIEKKQDKLRIALNAAKPKGKPEPAQ